MMLSSVPGKTIIRSARTPARPTTFVERALLFFGIALLPIEEHIPNVAGFSIMFIVFMAMAGYVLLWRFKAMVVTVPKTVFLAGAIFVAVAFLMEFAHGGNDFKEIIRLMVVGGVMIASLCRDRQAVSVSLWGFLIAGIWLSVILFLSMYGIVSSASGDNFNAAAQIRDRADSEKSLEGDLNILSFYASQGAVVALALGLFAKTYANRTKFLVMGGVCIIGTALPMSRGGILTLFFSFLAVIYMYGVLKPRVLAMGACVVFIFVMWVPDVIFSRMSVTIEPTGGERVEGRSRIYRVVIETLPEYFFTGVGRTNFYERWGYQYGFAKPGSSYVVPAHNAYAHVTIFWGLPGLLAFCFFVWQAYRCFPSRVKGDPLKLCLLGLAVSVLCNSMVVHTIYAKQFSIMLGILAGVSTWVWPHRVSTSSKLAKSRPRDGTYFKSVNISFVL